MVRVTPHGTDGAECVRDLPKGCVGSRGEAQKRLPLVEGEGWFVYGPTSARSKGVIRVKEELPNPVFPWALCCWTPCLKCQTKLRFVRTLVCCGVSVGGCRRLSQKVEPEGWPSGSQDILPHRDLSRTIFPAFMIIMEQITFGQCMDPGGRTGLHGGITPQVCTSPAGMVAL